MNHLPTWMFLGLNMLLGSIGLIIVLTKKPIIFIILGLELMIQAIIANFVVFHSWHTESTQGQVFAIFVTAISACEIMILLALALRLHQYYQNRL